jgi:thioredoxin:protein disulfide reductase
MNSSMIRGPAFTLLILGAAICAGASRSFGADKPDVGAKLVVPPSLAPASRGNIVVEMKIGTGWHVNSHTPSEKFLIPTNVVLTSSAGTLFPFRYPKDVEKRFSFSPEPLRVYEGNVRFETDLGLSADAKGTVEIKGSLTYQACNEKMCFAPARVPLEATISIAAPRGPR